MAVTAALTTQTVVGDLRTVIGTVAFDSSYPTNGEALTAATLGLQDLRFVHFSANSGYVFEYDYTNSKVKVYYGDNNNASDGPLIEVPNTTDLSALSAVKYIALGK